MILVGQAGHYFQTNSSQGLQASGRNGEWGVCVPTCVYLCACLQIHVAGARSGACVCMCVSACVPPDPHGRKGEQGVCVHVCYLCACLQILVAGMGSGSVHVRISEHACRSTRLSTAGQGPRPGLTPLPCKLQLRPPP